jgi:hypothetical protein
MENFLTGTCFPALWKSDLSWASALEDNILIYGTVFAVSAQLQGFLLNPRNKGGRWQPF